MAVYRSVFAPTEIQTSSGCFGRRRLPVCYESLVAVIYIATLHGMYNAWTSISDADSGSDATNAQRASDDRSGTCEGSASQLCSPSPRVFCFRTKPDVTARSRHPLKLMVTSLGTTALCTVVLWCFSSAFLRCGTLCRSADGW